MLDAVLWDRLSYLGNDYTLLEVFCTQGPFGQIVVKMVLTLIMSGSSFLIVHLTVFRDSLNRL